MSEINWRPETVEEEARMIEHLDPEAREILEAQNAEEYTFPPPASPEKVKRFQPMARNTLTKSERIELSQEQIEGFCRKHFIRELALFGSVLRDDFSPESDVDVLVEFEPGHVPGLVFFDMEAELSQIAGRKVELKTPQFLSGGHGHPLADPPGRCAELEKLVALEGET